MNAMNAMNARDEASAGGPFEQPTTTETPDHGDLHAAVDRHLAFHDHRYTKGRRRLVEVLARAGRPLTLPEISAGNSDVPQSSAYRNLDVLERVGIVRRISHTADHAYFELDEPFVDHHHHLVCIECGQLEDIHLNTETEQIVDDALRQAAIAAGFAPLHHSLDLHGYCAACQTDLR